MINGRMQIENCLSGHLVSIIWCEQFELEKGKFLQQKLSPHQIHQLHTLSDNIYQYRKPIEAQNHV